MTTSVLAPAPVALAGNGRPIVEAALLRKEALALRQAKNLSWRSRRVLDLQRMQKASRYIVNLDDESVCT